MIHTVIRVGFHDFHNRSVGNRNFLMETFIYGNVPFNLLGFGNAIEVEDTKWKIVMFVLKNLWFIWIR